jgi:N-methylhydantoinase A
VHCRLQMTNGLKLASAGAAKSAPTERAIYLRGRGRVSAVLRRLDHMPTDEQIEGPAIIESDYTILMLDDGAVARRLESGSLLITP